MNFDYQIHHSKKNKDSSSTEVLRHKTETTEFSKRDKVQHCKTYRSQTWIACPKQVHDFLCRLRCIIFLLDSSSRYRSSRFHKVFSVTRFHGCDELHVTGYFAAPALSGERLCGGRSSSLRAISTFDTKKIGDLLYISVFGDLLTSVNELRS
jgi:hypothetical protein